MLSYMCAPLAGRNLLAGIVVQGVFDMKRWIRS